MSLLADILDEKSRKPEAVSRKCDEAGQGKDGAGGDGDVDALARIHGKGQVNVELLQGVAHGPLGVD